MTFNWQAIAEWVGAIFVYDSSKPLLMGSMAFALLFLLFYKEYLSLKSFTYKGMLLYVIAFNLFFAYKANGLFSLLLPLTAVANYYLTQQMRKTESLKGKKRWLTGVVVLNLGLLAFFKYTNFVIGDFINALFATNFSLLSIILPIGISFYSFQAISYAVDLYRGKFTMEVTLLEYCFYLTFFPLLLAGPITRAKSLIPRLRRNELPSRRMLWGGLFLIILGLIKKNILSDYLAQFNNWVFDDPTNFSGFEDLMAMLGYPVQLYLDFSGYSDMSIGIAAIMGFWLPDNFWFPYRSLNLTDFWRRWHVSLSSWFRDYLYIPLGGNRKGTVRTYVNNFVTMLVAGLWHGASWMFVIWGGLHGIGLAIHKFFSRQLGLQIPNKWWGNALSWLLTYVYVAIAWTFFRAKDMGTIVDLYSHFFSEFSWDYLAPFWGARTGWCICLGLVMLSYLVPERMYCRLRVRFIESHWVVKLLLFVVCLMAVVQFSQESVQPFIYYDF